MNRPDVVRETVEVNIRSQRLSSGVDLQILGTSSTSQKRLKDVSSGGSHEQCNEFELGSQETPSENSMKCTGFVFISWELTIFKNEREYICTWQ
ncbi:hypothetical protein JTB14_007528 [Gonioctena quinquepunctata]|nr:hypothetical protein JTB14_007528 [Gonioctena quinquepunctata]